MAISSLREKRKHYIEILEDWDRLFLASRTVFRVQVNAYLTFFSLDDQFHRHRNDLSPRWQQILVKGNNERAGTIKPETINESRLTKTTTASATPETTKKKLTWKQERFCWLNAFRAREKKEMMSTISKRFWRTAHWTRFDRAQKKWTERCALCGNISFQLNF